MITNGSRRPALVPSRAILLAAGLGTRLKNLRENGPKALLKVRGRTLLDHALDHLERAGVRHVVINLHYKGEMIREHLAAAPKRGLEIDFSDESRELLDTGGGIAKALEHLGGEPFFTVNAKLLWSDGAEDALVRLARAYDEATMDALLLLVPGARAGGYDGLGDFDMDSLGRLSRRKECHVAPFVYSGIEIIHPRLFVDRPMGAFSLNLLWDKAVAAGRLFGVRHDGAWMHVSTPDALKAAEEEQANTGWV